MADARDLKSLVKNNVRVRFPSWVPLNSSVAQSAEQVAVNHHVAGSNPARGAIAGVAQWQSS